MIWIELLYYGAAVLIIIATILKAYKYREGFLLVIISSIILIWQSYILNAYNMVLIEVFTIFLAIFAFYKWSKNQNK